MKKKLSAIIALILAFCFLVVATCYADGQVRRVKNMWVKDTAYGSVWNGVARYAPSQNALYDYLSTLSVSGTEQRGFVINAALTTDDFLLAWRPAVPITIRAIYGVLHSGINVVGMVYICDAENDINDPMDIENDCDACDDTDITFDGEEDSDTDLNGTVAVGVGDRPAFAVKSVSSPGFLDLVIYYTVD